MINEPPCKVKKPALKRAGFFSNALIVIILFS
jgi:hypothetical protein